MPISLRILSLLPVLALAACATNAQTQFTPAPPPAVATGPVMVTPTPAQTTAAAVAMTDPTPFIDGKALALLSVADRGAAGQAQVYALQFGRPGAPRTWASGGAKGEVVVGPYVTVNNIQCRDFTHTVTVAGTAYPRKGTACREANGSWAVAGGAA